MTNEKIEDAKLRKVKLYGPMRKLFGREYELNVSSPAEAIRALCVQVPGFKKYLADSKLSGLTFAVFIGKRNVGEDGLKDPVGNDEIRIAPIIEGSKRGGILQTVLGVVLIVVGAVMNFYAPGSGAGVMQMGIAMAIGGVVQMLSPQPKGLGAKDDPNNQPSYSMDGAVNTQAQGNPVPLCYGGPLMIGGAIISGGIWSEDIATNA
ncbi:MAG: hypothetical protein [Caudoviricetes sp.]|nr:MAG: hypothetical protein [Caudoviricetes sp.]